jgi:hypothetical protein
MMKAFTPLMLIHMDTTMFLAQLWGPVLVAVGVGFFWSRSFYVRIYRDMEKAPFAVLFFGMAAISAGVAQVLAHNAWDTLPEVIVSLLGWGLLLKGLVCTVAPGIADRGGDIVVESKLMPAAGASVLIIGAYLSWLGYFV